METTSNNSPSAPEESAEFMSAESAFMMAIEKLKGNEIARDKVYVWRQRFKEGKLSAKKVRSILEKAGFKLAVEEKWIFLTKQGGEAPAEIEGNEQPTTEG